MVKKVNPQKSGMIDISAKEVTKRIAKASSTITLSKEAFAALIKGKSPKGDVLETAKVAGIMAAKNTPVLIPMCHPLELSKVSVNFVVNKKEHSVVATSEVVCFGRTGVEMEALVAASTAALTIYDMMKWADKGMVIAPTKLLSKSGGKSGDYKRA